MNAEIFGEYSRLNKTRAGRVAIKEYISAIEVGQSHDQAELIANHSICYAGHNIDHTGWVRIRVASIDHNEIDGVRLSLTIERDDDDWIVLADNEDTDMKFESCTDAWESISQRWHHDWNLKLAKNVR